MGNQSLVVPLFPSPFSFFKVHAAGVKQLKNKLPDPPKIHLWNAQIADLYETLTNLKKRKLNTMRELEETEDEAEKDLLKRSIKKVDAEIHDMEWRGPRIIQRAMLDEAYYEWRQSPDYLYEAENTPEFKHRSLQDFHVDKGLKMFMNELDYGTKLAIRRFWKDFEVPEKRREPDWRRQPTARAYQEDPVTEEMFDDWRLPEEQRGQPGSRLCFLQFCRWTLCVKLYGEDFVNCQRLRKNYQVICPNVWTNVWLEQQENHAFPAHHDLLLDRDPIHDIRELMRPNKYRLARSDKEWRTYYSQGRWRQYYNEERHTKEYQEATTLEGREKYLQRKRALKVKDNMKERCFEDKKLEANILKWKLGLIDREGDEYRELKKVVKEEWEGLGYDGEPLDPSVIIKTERKVFKPLLGSLSTPRGRFPVAIV